jgi:hypothetical protein
MATYAVEFLDPPDQRLRARRTFKAPNDDEAQQRAWRLYNTLFKGVTLDRYVLYEGKRAVHEHFSGPAR